MNDPVEEHKTLLSSCTHAQKWVQIQTDLGKAPNTVDAYRRALEDYLAFCSRQAIVVETARREDIARYVRDLSLRPNPRGQALRVLDSGGGLANATLQQRVTVVRLFYDYLMEEGHRQNNPVGRGRYTPSQGFSGILDPAHRLLHIRAEHTKGRRARTVPYSETTGILYMAYLKHRREISRERGPLFLSESRRNYARPISIWTWSKVIEGIANRSGVQQLTTHTLRHLCLTDLARANWDIHEIATFAGHRNPQTTLIYIHLSGRDLAKKLEQGMAAIHTWRVQMLAEVLQ